MTTSNRLHSIPESHIVAGGPDDFMTVRHLTLRGSQASIGRALAEESHARTGWTPARTDPTVERLRRRWFAANWPQHEARLTGVLDAFGFAPGADDRHLDGFTSLPDGSGCSAVFAPGAGEGGLVGRNYDFFTMSWSALAAEFGNGTPSTVDSMTNPAEPPMASRPYVLTTIPDDGLAVTALTMSEFSGCTEGINEAGLCVVLLMADVEEANPPEDAPTPQVGVDVMQLPRFVLDTCATVEEAKLALTDVEHYNQGAPCHYLIADAHGDAFVFERGHGGTDHFIEADGSLCVTNHLLHKHSDVDDLPEDNEGTFETYGRIRELSKRTADDSLTAQGLRDSLNAVSGAVAEGYPWRTMWRSILDPTTRTLSIRFYLGDEPDGDGGLKARYTNEITFEVPR